MHIFLNHPDKIPNAKCIGINMQIISEEIRTNEPTTSIQPEIIVIFSGELYNAEALADQINSVYDPQNPFFIENLIRNLYCLYGIEHTVRILDGAFSLVIFNMNVTDQISKIYFARDFFGMAPLYLSYGVGNIPKFAISTVAELPESVRDVYVKSEEFTAGTYAEYEFCFMVNSLWEFNYMESYFQFPLSAMSNANPGSVMHMAKIANQLLDQYFAESCRKIVALEKSGETIINCIVDSKIQTEKMIKTLRELFPNAIIRGYGITTTPASMKNVFEYMKLYNCDYFVFDNWEKVAQDIEMRNAQKSVVFTNYGIDLLFEKHDKNLIQNDKELRYTLLRIPAYFREWAFHLSYKINLKNPFFDREWMQLYMSLSVDVKKNLFTPT